MNPTHTIYGNAWTETNRTSRTMDSGNVRVEVDIERPAKRGAKTIKATVWQIIGRESAEMIISTRTPRKEWIPALSL